MLRSWLLIAAALPLSLAAPPAGSQADPPPTSDLVDLDAITGAVIDESIVATTVVVGQDEPRDPDAPLGSADHPYPTLRAGLAAAIEHLRAGRPTRVRIQPGVYREAADDLRFDDDAQVRQTLLVIEGTGGPGEVIWSGADVFDADGWTRVGPDLYRHDWPYDMGNQSPPWGPPRVIGHRSEMVFVDGEPMKQVVLERYRVEDLHPWSKGPVRWTYIGRHEPETALSVNAFGVYEREDNGNALFLRLSEQRMAERPLIEVAVRQRLLDLGAKRNLVLRNMTVQHVASPLGMFDDTAPLHLAGRDGHEPGNLIVEDCRFRWNSAMGFRLVGDGLTLRRSEFNANGFSGISGAGPCRNVVFDRTTTNLNGWRAHRGGELAWFAAAVKMHQTTGHKVLHHASVGNLLQGFWFDVHCKDLYMQDCVIVHNNMSQLSLELGQGPFHGRRLLVAAGKASLAVVWNFGTARIEDSVFWTNYIHDPTTAAIHWWSQARLAKERTGAPDADYHVRLERITPRRWEMVGNLLAADAGPPTLLKLVGAGDSYDPANHAAGVEQARYIGRNNVFAHDESAGQIEVWTHGRKEHIDFDTFVQRFDERGSIEIGDVRMIDPHNFDFRIADDSPVASRRDQWPAYRMPDQLRAEMEAMHRWAGYDGWAWPPVNEPD